MKKEDEKKMQRLIERKMEKKSFWSRTMDSVYKIVPKYALMPLIVCIAMNMIVYWGARIINAVTNRQFYDMTSTFDNVIPVIPFFVLFYVLAFPFWIASDIAVCRVSETQCRRMVTAIILGKLMCGIVFLLIPTTNVRPVVESDGLFSWGLNLIYALDKPDNLFPSIHCFESWMCFCGLRGQNRIPTWAKAGSFVMAILVCLATLFTKQHVFVDVLGGVLIAEVFWQLAPMLTTRRAHEYVKSIN